MEGPRIIELIQSIVFVLPVVMIIWKLSGVIHAVERHTKDIDGLGKKINDLLIVKNETDDMLAKKIEKIEKTLTEVSTSMQFIQRDVKEVKDDLKKYQSKN
jgi:uncharacterized protein YoxC